jgi:two-component system cell cycle sensor histidine kinase/response regulator CckA
MSHPPTAAVDRTERAGSPILVLLLALALVGAALAFSLLPHEQAARLIVVLLAALAVVGVFALFAYAVGLVQFSGHAARNDVTKAICDAGLDGLLVTDPDQRILYANDAYMALSGAHNPADLRTVERLFSGAPEVSEAIYRLAQAAREGKRGAEEVRLTPPLTGEGAVAWYRIRVQPVGRGSGKPATLWTVADVTRERERHENVFQELQHAIDFLDHAPAGFFSVEADGRVSYMNATLADWLDYDLAQVGSGGLRLRDVVAGDGSALVLATSGRPGDVRTERFDLDLKRRGGQSLPARMIHRVAFAADGTAGASRTLVINRAAGEEDQEELRAAEVRFARIFNTTPMAIASIDAQGRVLEGNAGFARLTAGAMSGGEKALPAAILERDREKLLEALAAAREGKVDVKPVDVTLAGKAEKSARIFLSAAEPGQNSGAVANVFALDTTELRTLQESFAQSQKMQAIGQLAGGVAHDFNNVLTAIIGFSDLLLTNHRPTDPSFHDIMQIKQNANRAAGLVRQLLAFSRRQTLRPQVLQLGELLADLQMLLRRLVGEKVEVELKHGRDLWLTKADANQFEQVVMNLVVNARDAMPEGGRITIRTRNVDAAAAEAMGEKGLPAADYVCVEVEDTGHGIPADVVDKIFEPFFTTKEVGKGTGLGLSTVYGIVKQTGGYVYARSQPGKGATFVVLLPRHVPSPEEMKAKVEAAKPVVADLTGQGTVLLVEDEEAVRAFGARSLASRGYTVLEAGSGLEALDVIEEHEGKIDLIVSDVVMPELDGPSMLGELRKRGVKAKIVFVSGYAEDAFEKNLPEGEEFGFLPKPFTLKQLVEAVKQHMG